MEKWRAWQEGERGKFVRMVDYVPYGHERFGKDVKKHEGLLRELMKMAYGDANE
jgi:hypothetical protein